MSFYNLNIRDRELPSILENIPGTTEHELRKLKKNISNLNLPDEKVPECPVMKFKSVSSNF